MGGHGGTPLRPCGTVGFPKGPFSRVPQGSSFPSSLERSSGVGVGGGEVPGKRSLPGSRSSQPLWQLPASERERFPAAGSSCQRFLPPPDAAALTQPVGRPLPRPFCPGAIVCELGGAGGGSTLPRESSPPSSEELGRRSPSGAGVPGQAAVAAAAGPPSS